MAKAQKRSLRLVRPKRAPPRNNRSRADRIADWNAAHEAGATYEPRKVDGKDARFLWISAVHTSDLRPMTRHVAHALVSYGTPAGERIFPGVRELARSCGCTQRSVCTHIEQLVRRGYLMRRSRGREHSAGARGFVYVLLIPRVLKELQHSMSVLKQVQHSAEGGSAPVLNAVQQNSPSNRSITKRPRATAVDNRARADAGKSAETLRRKLLAELAAGGRSRDEIASSGFGDAIAYAASIGCAIKPVAGEQAEAYRSRVREWETKHPKVDAWPDRYGQLQLGKGTL